MELVNQGGVDMIALGRKDLTPETRIAGNVEYLSSYVYRLVFNDNYSQAVSSEVHSDLSLTHEHNGFIPSVSLDRFQTFASSTNGDEARILHLPSLRFDVLDRPLGASPLYWGLGSSLGYLGRSEPHFHARNVGPLRLLSASLAALRGGGLERGSRGRAARHLLLHQPDPRPDRRERRHPHHQPRRAQPHRFRGLGRYSAAGLGARLHACRAGTGSCATSSSPN